MPRRTDREPTERQREWLEHLRSCGAQGLSLKAYADQAGLDVRRLYSWHQRLKRLGFVSTDPRVSFAPVRVQGGCHVAGAQRLHFPNGLMLECEGPVDLALVEYLLGLSQFSP